MDALAGPAAPADLDVMTFNLRLLTWVLFADLETGRHFYAVNTHLVPGGERDDWILTTPGVTALAALMNTDRLGTQYPSDHLPVQVRIRLP